MSVLRLYAEEMKGLPRGRFALAGAAAILGFVAFVAVSIAPDQLRAFGIVTLLIMPLFIAPFAAARMAGARATMLTHSLFTAPVTQRAWLVTNVLVSLTVGALYLLAIAPVLAVVAWHVGTDVEIFTDLLPIALGLIAFGTAFGTYLGVVFTGRSLVAPLGIATAVAMVSVMSGIFLSQMLAGVAPSTLMLSVLHLFPHVNLLDATSSPLSGDVVPVRARLSGLALGASVVGLLAVSAWTYLREQGPEDWETTPRRRTLLGALALLVLLSPAALANNEYEPRDWGHFHAPGPGTGMYAALARPGADAATLDFLTPHIAAQEDPMALGEANEREIVVLLPVDPRASLRDLTINISIPRRGWADPYLTLSTTFDVLVDGERAPLPGANAAGLTEGPVARIPVTITPDEAKDLSKNFYRIFVNVTYELEGEAEPRAARAQLSARADVPDAATQLLAASAPLPLLLAAAAVSRRRRVL